ncbi:hypothetical protein ACFO0M_27410 [Micromonospora mangrovi]|uniref:DUF4189 domain-containing protein n=2 Tax=Micromonospora TaxID=1873 RepID=A0AAU7MDC9_9ACTN
MTRTRRTMTALAAAALAVTAATAAASPAQAANIQYFSGYSTAVIGGGPGNTIEDALLRAQANAEASMHAYEQQFGKTCLVTYRDGNWQSGGGYGVILADYQITANCV